MTQYVAVFAPKEAFSTMDYANVIIEGYELNAGPEKIDGITALQQGSGKQRRYLHLSCSSLQERRRLLDDTVCFEIQQLWKAEGQHFILCKVGHL